MAAATRGALLALAVSVVLLACGVQHASASLIESGGLPTARRVVAVIPSGESVTDGRRNQQIRAALIAEAQRGEISYEIYEALPSLSPAELEISSAIQNSAQLAFFIGPALEELAGRVINDSSNAANYVLVDLTLSAVPSTRVSRLEFREDHMGYALGVLAALVTRSRRVAIVSGFPHAPTLRAVNGFREGVRSRCASCVVDERALLSESSVAVGGDAGIRAAVQGADVIFGFAGVAGSAAIQYALTYDRADGLPVFVIGSDADEYATTLALNPRQNLTLTSGQRDFFNATKGLISNWSNGTRIGAFVLPGCSDDLGSPRRCASGGFVSSTQTQVNNVINSLNSGAIRIPIVQDTGLPEEANLTVNQVRGVAFQSLAPPSRSLQAAAFVSTTSASRNVNPSLFVFGGLLSRASGQVSNDRWYLNRQTQSWNEITAAATRGTVPSERQAASMAVLRAGGDGRDYAVVFGGFSSNGQDAVDGGVHVVDTNRLASQGFETWYEASVAGPTPGPRGGHAISYSQRDATDSSFWMFGGRRRENDSTTWLNDLWRFTLNGSPANNFSGSAWTEVAPPPNATNWPRSLVFASLSQVSADLLVLVGGESESATSTSETWLFNISVSNWTRGPDMPSPRSRHGAVVTRNCSTPLVCENLVTIVAGRAANGGETLNSFTFSAQRSEWLPTLRLTTASCDGRAGLSALPDPSRSPSDAELAAGAILPITLVGGEVNRFVSPTQTSVCSFAFVAEQYAPFFVPPDEDNPCVQQVLGQRVQESPMGWGIALMIIVILVVGTGFLTNYNITLNRWDKISFDRLPLFKHGRFRRSLGDRLRQLMVLSDGLQIVAVIMSTNYQFNYWGEGDTKFAGAHFSYKHTEFPITVSTWVKCVFSLMILDLDEIGWWIGIEYNNVFFTVFFGVFAGAMFYVFLCGLVYSESERKCLGWGGGRLLVRFLIYIGPVFCHILFIPIMYNLLGVFACLKEYRPLTGGEWTPFMARDCRRTCYEGNHIGVAVMAAVALLAYLPTAVWTAPVWQLMQDTLTIQDQPNFQLFSIHWKLLLCIARAIFEQYNLLHATMLVTLMGVYFVVVLRWPPTTLPFMDLQIYTWSGVAFWVATMSVAGLFIRTWVTFVVMGCGTGLIFFLYSSLIASNLEEDGKWAPGTIAYMARKKREAAIEKRRQIEKKFRLMNLAQYNDALQKASNPRDVPPLDPRIREGGFMLEDDLVFVNKVTGRTVRILKIASRDMDVMAKSRTTKVLGLQLNTPIPSQMPMSYHLRKDATGTLLVMRAPDSTLYNYLRLKLNGYIAYYNAHDESLPKKLRKTRTRVEVEEAPFLQAVAGELSGGGGEYVPEEKRLGFARACPHVAHPLTRSRARVCAHVSLVRSRFRLLARDRGEEGGGGRGVRARQQQQAVGGADQHGKEDAQLPAQSRSACRRHERAYPAQPAHGSAARRRCPRPLPRAR
jgi:basic membrane protein A